jgi:hypothetical protein
MSIQVEVVNKAPSILQCIVHFHGIQADIVSNATQDASRLATRLGNAL